ncbi:uncharacterized protein FIBRA_05787 [Fibroporia radiculosa]|uniref:WLM domain-containing protein n=1 Tax=Fibroporia radiculosa TaxID=599839 RepID=J4GA37_9APHY|nr:uncharacterized protein FIBRA_05787 [Fibroporia radiculosa]CCM03643.1 predicted protein [Fibroporia radiculosa]
MSDVFVKSFTHLRNRPKADQALPLLQRIASLVKPIMRKHGWVLPVLAEFFPDSPNLVGLNINGGQKILLRLRPAHSPDTFYEEESIIHTMLHELTHNVHGPHDDKFYKFLSGLEEEYDALKRSGYAGEGFFSTGHRLGTKVSHNLPPHLARQKALEAAEKRRQTNQLMSGGGRLGGLGSRTRNNKSPRELAADAAERRAHDEKACASGSAAEREAAKAAQDSVEDKVIDLTLNDNSEPENVARSISRTSSRTDPNRAAPQSKSNGTTRRKAASGTSSNGALINSTPFPLNPSFKPPAPVSDRLRSVIYQEYMSNPKMYTVRKLSERHGLSIQRVDAILRLKGLEDHWRKKKPLQTGFQAGMEQILGVTERQKSVHGGAQGLTELGVDASEADARMDEEINHRARERYQRLFWEPVVEGLDPILPSSLERARADQRQKARATGEAKAAEARIPLRRNEEHIINVPGRPSWQFVDVGGKYVDVDDRIRRLKESERRSVLKVKRRQRKDVKTVMTI